MRKNSKKYIYNNDLFSKNILQKDDKSDPSSPGNIYNFEQEEEVGFSEGDSPLSLEKKFSNSRRRESIGEEG